MRAGDRFRFRPAVAFELGPDAREAGRLPIIIDSEPDDVFFFGLGVWVSAFRGLPGHSTRARSGGDRALVFVVGGSDV